MEKDALELCPLDGRYKDIQELLAPYFSEYAYFKNRVLVEINWLIYLIEKNIISVNDINTIKTIYENFDMQAYLKIKDWENITKHDVKAVEYYIDDVLKEKNMFDLIPFVHIGLTSEDINNTSYALMIRDFLNNTYFPYIKDFLTYLKKLSSKYKNIPMLAHTHGQPATPTTVGKEFKIYVYRLEEELKKLKQVKIKAKFNGATGNYSAFNFSYPNINSILFSKEFIEKKLNLTFNPLTTQIENHDYIVTILDFIRHINNIILDLNLDMWLYISKSYFKLEVVKNEVGSSTMPHKVNPINFENSEANLEIANGLLVTLSNKLPKSRMQRDLSDSSTLRNLGVSFGYSIQGMKETLKGLKKITINKEILTKELENEWEILAEPIQTILRKYGIPDAYNQLKDLTRGKKVTKEIIHDYIKELNISREDKERLLNLTPLNYIGLANKI